MFVDYQGHRYTYDPPTLCPWCHHSSQPNTRWTDYDTDNEGNHHMIMGVRCQYDPCTKIYVVDFTLRESGPAIKRYLNGHPVGPNWPEPINQLGSRFKEIYLQSLNAEHQGLYEVAGMGYRKALEFLIKDWAISQIGEGDSERDNKVNKIETSFLGTVINDFYSGDLKELMQRATWLGNDQAHYVQLFNDMPIDVIKELIGLIMSELDKEYRKAHYIKTIASRKL